ncbi:MAG TPA: hypothetical protein VI793_17455 [Anaerolineales bacterium]|nr:hypothetical protein [Anaerolineales bacterium]
MDRQVSRGLKTTFLVHFIVGGIFGLIYLLIPEAWGNLVAWPVKEPAIYRLIGAALLGFAASSWLAYRETAWEKVKIVVQMEIVWPILGTLVMLWGLIFAGLPAIGWLNAVILAGFAVAFSVFYARG